MWEPSSGGLILSEPWERAWHGLGCHKRHRPVLPSLELCSATCLLQTRPWHMPGWGRVGGGVFHGSLCVKCFEGACTEEEVCVCD